MSAKDGRPEPRWQGGDMLLTIDEVALILRRNKTQMYHMNANGEIPVTKVGKRCLYRHNIVANYVLNQDSRIRDDKSKWRWDRPVEELPRLWPPAEWPIDTDELEQAVEEQKKRKEAEEGEEDPENAA